VLHKHSVAPWQGPHCRSRSGSGGPAARTAMSSIWPFGNPFGHPGWQPRICRRGDLSAECVSGVVL